MPSRSELSEPGSVRASILSYFHRGSFMRSSVVGVLMLCLFAGPVGAVSSSAAPAQTLSQVFKRVGDSVVVIRTVGREAAAREPNGPPASVRSIGSGVLVSQDGKVMTAAHVVQTADAIAVEFPGQVLVKAKVIASDPAADVALLQLERVPPGAVTARIGDSDRAEVGDEVFVVGAPLGITHTLTVGHLSARRRTNSMLGGMATTELFQTDAAINQGNSGGPMFNMQGEVIGVVSHIVSLSGGSEGLGFVVTSNMAQRLLFDERSVWSGLEGYLLAGDIARAFNLPVRRSAVLVQRVAEGSPAQLLGVRGGTVPATIGEEELVLGGDIIVSVAGIPLDGAGSYEEIRRRLIQLRASGGSLSITVLREGSSVELTGSMQP
jgi:S1-C subfamily serine protease